MRALVRRAPSLFVEEEIHSEPLFIIYIIGIWVGKVKLKFDGAA
jgi:hypothetical protein